MKKFLLLLLSVCGLYLLHGCGSSTPPPPPATHFSVMVIATSATAGTSFNVTVSALDASGAVVPSYSGMVHFTSTDSRAVLPKDSPLSNGAGTFSVTLKTAGTQTVTATDSAKSSITGSSNSISVVVPASHFSLTVPSNATTGFAFNITVTALDATNNTVTSYSGTVHFTSTDGQATLPVDSTFANGTGTFSATLKTLGNQTITATDIATASVAGISSAISVGTAAATHFSMSGPLFGDASPGGSLRLVVTALNAANNTASGYSGTVHFTSTDPLASLPANSTLTNGSGTFSATLNTVGSQTITATDTVTQSVTGASHFNIAKLTITSGLPPNGTVGVAYGSTPNCYSGPGFALGASGGNPGFHGSGYVWASTSLPPGLQLGTINYVSGSMCSPGGGGAIPVILGAPTQAGTYNNVVITLHDNETPQATASATYRITIGAASSANHAGEALVTLDSSTSHHHYKLIDLGTFGGPNSFVDCCELPPTVLNNRGTVAGGADGPVPNPSSANPNPLIGNEIFVNTAFKWQDGVLTNLGTLPGGYNSFAASINASGQVVGTSENGETDLLRGYPQSHPVLWKGGEVFDLGTLGGYEGVAFQSNNRGLIVGVATNAVPDSFPGFPNCIVYGQQSRAFLWKDGAMQDLGTLGGTDSTAEFVNDRGQIAGASYTNAALNPVSTGCGQSLPTQNPFLWEDGRMIDLGTLGGNFGDVAGINNRGQVAGISDLAGDLTYHAFLWDHESGMKDLGTLGGTFSQADALTEAGEVVGGSTTPNDQGFDAFLWKDGVITDLGILPGDCATGAYAINSKEQIVGDSFLCDGSTRPFLWENGQMISLQDFVLLASGFRLGEPSSINDRGEIAGYGFLSNGDSHAFLLIPCDQDHPGLEGCNYDTVDAETAAQVRPAQITQAPTAASEAKLSPAEVMTRFRSLIARRYHPFGTPQTSLK